MTWSYSQLNAYETCPVQFYELKIAQNFQETLHPTTAWGTRGHLALEERVRDGTPLPAEFAYLEGFASKICELPGVTMCEEKVACKRDYAPTAFDSTDAWSRGIIDVFNLRDTEAVVVDYKFGKVRPSSQLKLNALLIFANYPFVRTVKTRFLWLAHRQVTEGVYERKDMAELWSEFEARAAQLERAKEEGVFQPKPSGLCVPNGKGYKGCVVTTCEYCGVGNKRRW